MINNKSKLNNGYIALSSVLVVGAILVSIIMSSTLLSISSNQISLSNKLSFNALNQVESCIEDGLLRLNKTGSIPSQITLPQGSCTIINNNQTGNTYTFTINTSFNNYQKTIQVQAQRINNIKVLSWVEQ